MRFTLRGSLILCLSTIPSFADGRLPLQDGQYHVEGTRCEGVGNEKAVVLRNQIISITETQCHFLEPKLIGDGEYSLEAKCDQPELRAEFLNEVQLEIIAADKFLFDDGLKLRSYMRCPEQR